MSKRILNNERGFTLAELLVASGISLVLLASASTAFKQALDVNEAVMLNADSSQNLRAGTNLLVRDLMQAGRRVPVGGFPTPTGPGTVPVKRPGPPGSNYTFSNTLDIQAINPGPNLGPTIENQATDIVTFLMVDTESPLEKLYDFNDPNDTDPTTLKPTINATGSAMTIPSAVPINDSVTGLKQGDLIMFQNASGLALQYVTSVSGQTVNFAAGDPFSLNQRSATEGSITQILGTSMAVNRVIMLTYYVDVSVVNTPRLVRQVNLGTPRALAGVVEDLKINYDLVDGVTNPTNIPAPVLPDTAAQIRKVNLHVGVRSETRSVKTKEYVRNHVNTQISLRGLAFVDRYR